MDCFQERTVTANTLERLFERVDFNDFDFLPTNFDNILVEWPPISFFHNFFIFFNHLCLSILYASEFLLRLITRNAFIIDTILIFLALIGKIVVHLKMFLLDIFISFLCLLQIKMFLLDIVINLWCWLWIYFFFHSMSMLIFVRIFFNWLFLNEVGYCCMQLIRRLKLFLWKIGLQNLRKLLLDCSKSSFRIFYMVLHIFNQKGAKTSFL